MLIYNASFFCHFWVSIFSSKENMKNVNVYVIMYGLGFFPLFMVFHTCMQVMFWAQKNHIITTHYFNYDSSGGLFSLETMHLSIILALASKRLFEPPFFRSISSWICIIIQRKCTFSAYLLFDKEKLLDHYFASFRDW